MKKIEFKKDFKELFSASAKKPSLVKVPKMNYLMVDGAGAPEHHDFQDAIGALYGVAYTIKFTLKAAQRGPEYTIAPLEALWSTTVGDFDTKKKQDWRWTVMIMCPNHLTKKDVAIAVKKFWEKKPDPAILKVRLGSFAEGLAAQVMHIGPYAAEQPTLDRLYAFIEESGYEMRGQHHEIYFSDPYKTKPEKLRTLLRQPVSQNKR